jgi:ABC-2 type transport system ATP-binding protein
MTALQTSGLTKRFGDVVAVRDLDLSVESGEVFGFLGPNGAGKSTTISILLGFLDPSEGEATVLGHDATAESRAVRSRVGLLPEGYDVYPNLTGREHVASAIETKGAADDPDEVIERVGLAPDDARRPAGDYSTGMRQRLMLGVALTGSPDLLILDEPSSGLDPQGIKRLRSIVRAEADRGATVFFSSHILGEVEKVCDRVGIMNAGELVAVDAIDDLREEMGAGGVVEASVASAPDLEAVRAVEGVREAVHEGGVVRVTCADPRAKMPALRRIDDATTVTDVAVEDASLESLFEEYTDGAAPSAEEPSETAPAAQEGDA